METTSSAVAERKDTVRSLLSKDAYKARFNEILGKRAGQFMASIVQASNSYSLRDCNPNSIIAAAIVAASLDLPIDKNLGFAHIVPYKGVASFQMGYKGFIQLALRSGQFKSMRDAKVNAEAFEGYDSITGDPKINWTKLDETKVIIGYAFAWRLTNGFEKIVYWTQQAVEAHAQRFSQAYKAKKKDSPWVTDFDSMALKTVIKSALAKWAPLSLEMQQAVARDESAQVDLDAEPSFLDGANLAGDGPDEPKKPIFSAPAGADPAAAGTPGAQKTEKLAEKVEEKNPDLEPAKKVAIEMTPERKTLIEQIEKDMLDKGMTEKRFLKVGYDNSLMPPNVSAIAEMPTDFLQKIHALAFPKP